MSINLGAQAEEWPLAKPFVIARGAKTHAHVVTVELAENGKVGRSECVPYARYSESVEGVLSQIEAMREAVEGGISRTELRSAMAAGAARNVIDCALWDLEAKRSDCSVYNSLGFVMPKSVPSVETVSIDDSHEMAMAARRLKDFPVIKVKLDAEDILQRVDAVHKGAPKSQILIDANESWSLDLLNDVVPELVPLNVVMIEQPLPAGDDQLLRSYTGSIALGADESCHTTDDLARLAPLYR